MSLDAVIESIFISSWLWISHGQYTNKSSS